MITVFSKNNCIQCKMTKMFLTQHHVDFVEHNIDVIKCADYVIDLGPKGGDKGGNLVFSGTPNELIKCNDSFTGQFLKQHLNAKNY